MPSQHFFDQSQTGPSDVDVQEFVLNNADGIREQLNRTVQKHRCVKYYATIDVQFYRMVNFSRPLHVFGRHRSSCQTQANIDIHFVQ